MLQVDCARGRLHGHPAQCLPLQLPVQFVSQSVFAFSRAAPIVSKRYCIAARAMEGYIRSRFGQMNCSTSLCSHK
jgi:hypothetical protein